MLIHAGDHTFRGSASEIRAALNWLASLPHRQSELSADPVDALVVCDDAVSTQHVITDSTETKSRTLI